jgi:hypothetical protein
MKFVIVCLLAIFFSQMALADNIAKVALIVSLDDKDGKAFFNGPNYDVSKRIEKDFKKYFDPKDFEIVVIKNATLASIWKTLHDPTYHGIFFVGHAHSSSIGAINTKLIADQNMYNVKNAFQSVQANLRYLAFLSCNAEGIIQNFIEKNYYANAPELRIKAFNAPVELSKGLEESILNPSNPLVKFQTYDEIYPHGGPCQFGETSNIDEKTCEKNILKTKKLRSNPDLFKKFYADKTERGNLIIKRVIPNEAVSFNVQSTLIMANEKVIGFFDKGMPGEIQTIRVTAEERVTLSNDSGAPSTKMRSDIVLGELEVSGINDQYCELDGFRNSKGELLGVGKNVYQLKCFN